MKSKLLTQNMRIQIIIQRKYVDYEIVYVGFSSFILRCTESATQSRKGIISLISQFSNTCNSVILQHRVFCYIKSSLQLN